MPDYTLVPVDYQPDFGDYSLVPVDHDPFAEDGVAQPSQLQYAQAQPQSPLQQQPGTGAGQANAGAQAATPIDPLASNGVLTPLFENGRVDSYVYKKLSTGTPPTGPQVSTGNGNYTVTATDNAKRTNFGGIYGHTLTISEPSSSNLLIITHPDPAGLLVATPDESDPSSLRLREYKGY
jgi:hypothetical protein